MELFDLKTGEIKLVPAVIDGILYNQPNISKGVYEYVKPVITEKQISRIIHS